MSDQVSTSGTAAGNGSPEDARRTYGYVTDEQTAGRVGAALFRLLLHSGRMSFILMYLAVAVLIALKWLKGDWYWVLTLTGLLILVPAMFFWSTRKQAQALFPVGQALETEFGQATLVIRTPGTTAEVELASISKLQQHGDVVFFQQGDRRLRHVLPLELFPQEEQDRLRRGLEPQSS